MMRIICLERKLYIKIEYLQLEMENLLKEHVESACVYCIRVYNVFIVDECVSYAACTY